LIFEFYLLLNALYVGYLYIRIQLVPRLVTRESVDATKMNVNYNITKKLSSLRFVQEYEKTSVNTHFTFYFFS